MAVAADPAQRDQTELRAMGAVCREVGLTARTVRYYEEIGLLRPAVRVKGSDRLFDASDVQRLQEIKRLRDVLGFSLAEVATFLDSEDVRAQLRAEFRGTSDPQVRARVLRDALDLADRRLALIEGKLRQVEALRDEEMQWRARIRALLETEELRFDGEASPR